jgi:hypothetical protein
MNSRDLTNTNRLAKKQKPTMSRESTSCGAIKRYSALLG